MDVHIHQLGGGGFPMRPTKTTGSASQLVWRSGLLPVGWRPPSNRGGVGKTARGADGRTYPWGNNGVTGSKANYCDKNCPKDTADSNHDDGYARTARWKISQGASHYGAQDMAGNVEWVADWYDGSYYSQPGNTDNPQGPPDGDYKIMRRFWDRERNLLRSSYRVGSQMAHILTLVFAVYSIKIIEIKPTR